MVKHQKLSKYYDYGCSHRSFMSVKKKDKFWLKLKFLKQADFIGIIIAKLRKYFKISKQTTSISSLQKILWETKRFMSSFLVTFFVEFFLVFLLVDYTTEKIYFPSYSLKCINIYIISSLVFWWRHKERKKAFEVELKSFFLVLKVVSLRLKYKESKNVLDIL